MRIYVYVYEHSIRVVTTKAVDINITMGIRYILQLLAHPYQPISATCLYFTMNLEKLCPFCDDSLSDLFINNPIHNLNTDISRIYSPIELTLKHQQLKDQLYDAVKENDPVQESYYRAKIKRLEESVLNLDIEDPDSLVKDSYKSVWNDIDYAYKNICNQSPELYHYLKKTIVIGSILSHRPDFDDSIELILV